jgi:beta-phosphoglucomutase-like phosphatase (HAD superfamily)
MEGGCLPFDDLSEGVKAARAAGALQWLGEAMMPDGKPKPLPGDIAKSGTDLSR